jgi:hypothetical protein
VKLGAVAMLGALAFLLGTYFGLGSPALSRRPPQAIEVGTSVAAPSTNEPDTPTSSALGALSEPTVSTVIAVGRNVTRVPIEQLAGGPSAGGSSPTESILAQQAPSPAATASAPIGDVPVVVGLPGTTASPSPAPITQALPSPAPPGASTPTSTATPAPSPSLPLLQQILGGLKPSPTP